MSGTENPVDISNLDDLEETLERSHEPRTIRLNGVLETRAIDLVREHEFDYRRTGFKEWTIHPPTPADASEGAPDGGEADVEGVDAGGGSRNVPTVYSLAIVLLSVLLVLSALALLWQLQPGLLDPIDSFANVLGAFVAFVMLVLTVAWRLG